MRRQMAETRGEHIRRTHCSKLMYLTTVALDSSNHRAQMSEEVSVKSTSVSCSQRAVQNTGSNHKHKNEARPLAPPVRSPVC